MAKKTNGSGGLLWNGIEEEDFINESNITDEDIGDYNKHGMEIFSANVNLMRQLARITDSLKLVERRILYAMYQAKATPGHHVKSETIISKAMTIHHHGDGSLYASLVFMIQYWKKGVALAGGDCNWGSITAPDTYAAERYTEVELSKYAYECFFEDFSENAIPMDEHLTGAMEPKYLPSKFPNILINGTMALSYGFSAFVPPYNVTDVIEVTKKLIKDPETPDDELIIYPDFPTGCDIVDDPGNIREICRTGRGSIRMRANIDIEETEIHKTKKWILHIRSIPYNTAFDKIYDQILKLGKAKAIPFEDLQQRSYAYEDKSGQVRTAMDLAIILPGSEDPKAIRTLLYKNTNLEKTLAVNFTVIVGDNKIKTLNLRDLVLTWINSRREYKRALYNHRANYLAAEISIRNIMIELLKESNIEKTIGIIKRSNSAEVIQKLCKEYKGMDSLQAKAISQKPLNAFTKDARKRYKEELETLEEEYKRIIALIKNPKKQDDIILEELEDLRKYATPRKSKIIKVSGFGEEISDSKHVLVFTDKGKLKKLPYEPERVRKTLYGNFDQGDNPSYIFNPSNLNTIIMFDSKGKYAIIPVFKIPGTTYNDTGTDLYDLCRLDGPVVYATTVIDGDYQMYSNNRKKYNKSIYNDIEDLMITVVTAKGNIKYVPMTDFLIKNDRDIMAIKGTKYVSLKDDDRVVYVGKWSTKLDNDLWKFMMYTNEGEYVLIGPDHIDQGSKTSMGNFGIIPHEGDEVAGFSVISDEQYLIIITQKGFYWTGPIGSAIHEKFQASRSQKRYRENFWKRRMRRW